MKSKDTKLKETLSIPVYLDNNGNLCIGLPNANNTPVQCLNNSATAMFNDLLKNNSKFKSANKLANLIHPRSPHYLLNLNNHKILTAVVECPDLIPLLPEKFFNDNFILRAIQTNPRAINHLPEKFFNDNFILRAIQTKPKYIDYLTLDQKKYIIKMVPAAAAQCKPLIADLIYTDELQNIIKTTKSRTFILLAEHTIRRFNLDGYPGSHTPITDYNFNHTPNYLINKKPLPDSLLRYANDNLRNDSQFVINMGIVNPVALYSASWKLTQDASLIEQASKLDSLMVPKHAFMYADPSITIKESKKIWNFLKRKGAFDENNRDRLCISQVQNLLNDTRNNLEDIPKEIGKTKIVKALNFLKKEFETPQLISKDFNNKDYLEFMLELVRRNPTALYHANPELAQNNWFLDHLNKHIPHQTIPKGAFINTEIDLRQSEHIYRALMKSHPNIADLILDPTGRIQYEPDKRSLSELLEKHVNPTFLKKHADHIFNVLHKAYKANPAQEADTKPWVIETHASNAFKERMSTFYV